MADVILANLKTVADERVRRRTDGALGLRVTALKDFQKRRFAHTYADLLASPRYAAAARFFLEELYGPGDFSLRDAQFSRVVPALVRLFPDEVVQTVRTLSELHALTELLDTAMASNPVHADWTPLAYLQAWQVTGRPSDRNTQIELTVKVASDLDALTRKPLLRNSLRLMRGPARVAGLSELQRFLEAGFDTFGAMRGAAEFIRLIETRERAFVAALFAADPGAVDAGASRAGVWADLERAATPA